MELRTAKRSDGQLNCLQVRGAHPRPPNEFNWKTIATNVAASNLARPPIEIQPGPPSFAKLRWWPILYDHYCYYHYCYLPSFCLRRCCCCFLWAELSSSSSSSSSGLRWWPTIGMKMKTKRNWTEGERKTRNSSLSSGRRRLGCRR